MGAIGGAVDFKNCNIDFSSLKAIKNAQALRGRRSSVAYLDSGIGMFYNADDFFEYEQPVISERRGYKSAMVVDADSFDAKIAMEAYRAYGVEFVGMLDIPFAMAIYDGERRMLMLARDRNGRKPLYYTLRSGKVFFASEPKGILSVLKAPIKVNADILSLHLTSPVGIYGASDIYCDIHEVRRGECILFTELGISKFFYRRNSSNRFFSDHKEKCNEKVIEPNCDIDAVSLFASLEDSLIAFDMPEFDAYMPSLCRLFLGAKSNKSFRFADPIKRYNLSYSYEREDRLNSFYGKRGIGVMSAVSEPEGAEQARRRMKELLTDSFFSLERNDALFLRQILGDEKMNCLLRAFSKNDVKKENTDQLVRILGMLRQAAEWSRLRELELIFNK